jgi:coenzyme F420-reducing hydrogenase delta subunit
MGGLSIRATQRSPTATPSQAGLLLLLISAFACRSASAPAADSSGGLRARPSRAAWLAIECIHRCGRGMAWHAMQAVSRMLESCSVGKQTVRSQPGVR